MYGIGLLAPVALLPQVIQVFHTHDVSSLSLVTWLMLGIINALWAVYGYVHREGALIIANACMAVLNFAVAIGILMFS
jgi:MtN3 and saliva related transmembrane protein